MRQDDIRQAFDCLKVIVAHARSSEWLLYQSYAMPDIFQGLFLGMYSFSSTGLKVDREVVLIGAVITSNHQENLLVRVNTQGFEYKYNRYLFRECIVSQEHEAFL